MKAFRFAAELLEARSAVQAALSDAEILWLSHYSSVDCLHDLYGIEVSGIKEQHDAHQVKKILQALFPEWQYVRCYFKDYGGEPGWCVMRSKEPERFDDRWNGSAAG